MPAADSRAAVDDQSDGGPAIPPPSSAPPSRPVPYGALAGGVVILYFGREILVPLALAILFSFLLGPLVRRLERFHFWRVPAVMTIAALFFGIVGLVGWLATSQVMDLANRLPGYQGNIQAKLVALRGRGGSLNTAAKVLEGIEKKAADSAAEAKSDSAASTADHSIAAKPTGTEMSPLTVRVVEPPVSPPLMLRNLFGPLLAPLTTAMLVVIFTVFMLIQREDLRDRLLHLAGPNHLPQTTQAVDEASQRVSRYLLMQVTVNLTFGAAIAGGLLLVGVPNAALWGVLTVGLRFIPYIGVWMSAAGPLAIALAAYQSWWPVFETAALFATFEVVTGNAIEPWLYGATTGLSPVAVIVAASFWTWLWGGVGLLLSIPLTTCIVVLGRYVPQLIFLHKLLGEESVVAVEARLYQRLLAFDEEEASQLVDEYLTGHTVAEFYDAVLIPAINQAQFDARQGYVSEERRQFIRQTVRALLEDLRDRPPAALAPAPDPATDDTPESAVSASEQKSATPVPAMKVLIVPIKTEEDELAGMMLAHLLALASVGSETLSAKTLANEALEAVAARGVDVVCLSAVRPFAVMQARYLAKRLHGRFPELKILVGLWDQRRPAAGSRRSLQSAPIDWVVGTLVEAIAEVCPVVHCRDNPALGPTSECGERKAEKPHDLVAQTG